MSGTPFEKDPKTPDSAYAGDGTDDGGDPVCWLPFVCPECGAMSGTARPFVCATCHAEVPAED